jgi:amidophosphoribosyltransferase
LSNEEVCRVLGADGLMYQSVEDLMAVANKQSKGGIAEWEDSCFTGHYVTGDIDARFVENAEEKGRGKDRAGLLPAHTPEGAPVAA